MYDELKRVVEQRSGEPEALVKAREESSKKRLVNTLRRKLTATFVGSLVQMETYFGTLWGHGKDIDELSEQEAVFRELWEECRKQILDNGNQQIHAVDSEISQYSVMWNQHKMLLNKVGK